MSKDFTFLNFHDELYKLYDYCSNQYNLKDRLLPPTFANPRVFAPSYTYDSRYKYVEMMYAYNTIVTSPTDHTAISYDDALSLLGEEQINRVGNSWFQQQYRLLDIARYVKTTGYSIEEVAGYGTESSFTKALAEAIDDFNTEITENNYPILDYYLENITRWNMSSTNWGRVTVANFLLSCPSFSSTTSGRERYAKVVVEYYKKRSSSYIDFHSFISGVPETEEGDTERGLVDMGSILLPDMTNSKEYYNTLPFELTPLSTTEAEAVTASKNLTANHIDFYIIGDLQPETNETED